MDELIAVGQGGDDEDLDTADRGRATRPFARRRTPSPDERARVVFLGSGTFAIPSLEALAADPDLEIVAVVSAPDRLAGRGAALRPVPVAEAAGRLGAPAQARPAPLGRRRRGDQRPRPDLGVLADYGQIVPATLLEVPGRGMLNLHPSLLPRHRGAARFPPRSWPAIARPGSACSGWTRASTSAR